MKTARVATSLGILSVCSLLALAPGVTGQSKVLRGWLSDEGCARARANSGVYTGTNPDCAKRCVAEGKKIVLVLPEEKQILDVANQDAARENIGDYVEITGSVDQQAKTVRVDSLKLLEKGRAKCDPPRSSKDKK
jgi:hypothetical protein